MSGLGSEGWFEGVVLEVIEELGVRKSKLFLRGVIALSGQMGEEL